jgi:hypothetical protein
MSPTKKASDGVAGQIVSKKRVEDHGEVFTADKEVNAMLDLVNQELLRVESKVLEPACGDGNFLARVLERKLKLIKSRYSKSQIEFEKNSIIAFGGIYGIDILNDNVLRCRERLIHIFLMEYEKLYPKKSRKDCVLAIKFILEKNIIWGDALTLKTIDKIQPITFSEWSPIGDAYIKRRDYTFMGLMGHTDLPESLLVSDLGKEVYIPTPIKEFPPTNHFKIFHVD